METVKDVAAAGKARAADAVEVAKETAVHAKDMTIATVRDRTVQMTVASAVAGAVVVGTGAMLAGLVAGGVAGGAIGILGVPFSFGLSIPAGAALGGGLGALTGAIGGGTVGAAGFGGTVYAFKKRGAISHMMHQACSRLMGGNHSQEYEQAVHAAQHHLEATGAHRIGAPTYGQAPQKQVAPHILRAVQAGAVPVH